jgi:hypothetical protein
VAVERSPGGGSTVLLIKSPITTPTVRSARWSLMHVMDAQRREYTARDDVFGAGICTLCMLANRSSVLQVLAPECKPDLDRVTEALCAWVRECVGAQSANRVGFVTAESMGGLSEQELFKKIGDLVTPTLVLEFALHGVAAVIDAVPGWTFAMRDDLRQRIEQALPPARIGAIVDTLERAVLTQSLVRARREIGLDGVPRRNVMPTELSLEWLNAKTGVEQRRALDNVVRAVVNMLRDMTAPNLASMTMRDVLRKYATTVFQSLHVDAGNFDSAGLGGLRGMPVWRAD